MKKYVLFLCLLPLGLVAQKTAPANESKPAVAAVGFTILGNFTGYPDGTTVSLHNGNSGAQEQTTQIKNNSFSFSGRVETPDFKVLVINGKAPYLTLFIDNSVLTINGKADSLEYCSISGSASQLEFMGFDHALKPYADLFSKGSADTVMKKAASAMLVDFAEKHPNSYLSPLAAWRNFQLNADYDILEKVFMKLNATVKNGPIGQYVAQQIMINKNTPQIGKPLPDFSQADVNGKMVSLHSFKGKYVLVDFWASWCRPCRAENPNVVNAYKKYKDKNFTVLGVSFDKTKEPWLEAIKDDGLTWTHVSDLKGFENAIGKMFMINQIPQNLLIDPKGILIGKNMRGNDLELKLDSIFKN